MATVRSFDVFDTLVGRLHKEPHSTFSLIETKYPLPKFKALRLAAEATANGTLDDIYRHLAAAAGLSQREAQKLRACELALELSNVFPITRNLSQVRDGDLIVADTYYSADEIRQILRQVGLDKDIEIFTSYNGKFAHTIWPKLLSRYPLASHLGSQPHTDLFSPTHFGIKSVWFKENNYTMLEFRICAAQHKDLADLMRTLRLSNPYQPGTPCYAIWHEQTQYNLPILLMAALYLDAFCKRHGKRKVLFSSSTCCHLIVLFRKLFPQYEALYFHSAPAVYQNPSAHYCQYVKSVYSDDAVIVDGQACANFFAHTLQHTPHYVPILSTATREFSVAQGFEEKIGQLNCPLEGQLIDYSAHGPLHAPLQYNSAYIQSAYACIQKCVAFLDHYRMNNFDQILMDYLIGMLFELKPALPRWDKKITEREREKKRNNHRDKNAATHNSWLAC